MSAVVLDLMMPRVSGFESLELLQQYMPDRKCVIVVSAASQENIDGVDGRSIFARFRKPFDLEELVNAVRACTAG